MTQPMTHYRGWFWRGGATPRDLVLEKVKLQPLCADEVLVHNTAIGLNPVDWKVLSGQLGKIPGVDGAGIVVAAGADVNSDWIGRRVAYHQSLQQTGSFAEFTPVRAQVLLSIPDAVDELVAASFPCPALTAWQAIEKIPVKPGLRVLISGAGGSVGRYLVQLARSRGFHVSVMCHSRHWATLKELGAQDCMENPDDHPDQSWPVSERSAYFAIIDCVSAAHAAFLAPALEANGHLVCIQGRAESWPNPPFGAAWSMHEVALGALHQYGSAEQWRALTDAGNRLLQMLAAGTLQAEPVIADQFLNLPIQLERLQHRNFTGKLVIRVD